MKIYSKGQLVFAAFAFLNVLIRIRSAVEGDAWDAVMIVLWGITGLISLCFAFDQEYGEREQRQGEWARLASRQLFGRWHFLVEYLGVGLILISMIGALVSVNPRFPLVLVLAGVVYTVAIDIVIGKRVKRMEAEGERP